MNGSIDKRVDIKEYVMPTLVLVIICLVVTFALVTTYKITAPIIKATAEKSAEIAREEALSGSEGFELVASSEQVENIVDVYKANNGRGYVITSSDKGYGGEIIIITGFSADGLIEKVMLLEQEETPGVGTKAGEEPFTDQFIGVDTQQMVENTDTISGATISSKAVKRAVSTALEEIAIIKKGGF